MFRRSVRGFTCLVARGVSRVRRLRHRNSNLGHPEYHQIYTGFFNWVVDAMEPLKQFVRKVVKVRRGEGVRSWAWCLRVDSVHICVNGAARSWFLTRLIWGPKDTPCGSGIPHEPHAQPRKAWMPFFRRKLDQLLQPRHG